MPGDLKTILEKFKSRLAYRQMDKEALNISRSLAGGNLGPDRKYAEPSIAWRLAIIPS